MSGQDGMGQTGQKIIAFVLMYYIVTVLCAAIYHDSLEYVELGRHLPSRSTVLVFLFIYTIFKQHALWNSIQETRKLKLHLNIPD